MFDKVNYSEYLDDDLKHHRRSTVDVADTWYEDYTGFYSVDWITGESCWCPVKEPGGYFNGKAF